ncbi:MAG: hypothetical protein HY238_22130 [Acidobacteria bacterium]|nr:hypothetical protein [Acidobacteriota bacterium]
MVPTHALLECFSVLTRLPGDYRMPSDEAKQLLEENFSTDAIVPGIDAGLVWSCVAKVVQEKVVGGRVYDAIIAHSAVRAGAVVLVTWNAKDFLTVAPPGLEIREPGGHSVRVPRVH